MISPEDIRARALKLWDTQRIQRAHLEGLSLFPWELPIPRPSAKELADGFARLRTAIQQLEKGAKTTAGASNCRINSNPMMVLPEPGGATM